MTTTLGREVGVSVFLENLSCKGSKPYGVADATPYKRLVIERFSSISARFECRDFNTHPLAFGLHWLPMLASVPHYADLHAPIQAELRLVTVSNPHWDPAANHPLCISRLDGTRGPPPGKARRPEQLSRDPAHAGLNCSGSDAARKTKSGSLCVSRPGNEGVAGRYSPGS